MPTYKLYGIISASQYLGEVEANSEEEAEKLGWDRVSHVSLCCECSRKLDIGEVYEVEVGEVQ